MKTLTKCVVVEKTHTIDAGSDDMVSGYLKLIDCEILKIDKGKLNEAHQNEKIIYEVNKNGNDIITILIDLIHQFHVLMKFIHISSIKLMYFIVNHLQIATDHIICFNLNSRCIFL